jgi:hypothetical protein
MMCMMNVTPGRLAQFLLALLLGGCSSGPPAAARLVSATELGVLDQSDAIQGRDGGDSVRLWGHSIWVFGDTVLNIPDIEGQSWHHNSFSFTNDEDASDGIGPLVERNDTAGAPEYFIAPTSDEAAFNAAHRGEDCAELPCGARFAVWPGAPVWDDTHGRALIFYGLIYAEPGAFNFHGIGDSIAVWTELDAARERPEHTVSVEHPTLMWEEGELAPGVASQIIEDEVFSFACPQSGFGHSCKLMSAPLDRVLERDAWRVWDGSGWSDDPGKAKTVFDGASIMSVDWNDFLGAFLAVYSEPLSDNVVMRTAPALTGPWSRAEHLFTTSQDAYDAVAHDEFAEDGGRVIYVTYSRATGKTWFSSELALVRVELERH